MSATLKSHLSSLLQTGAGSDMTIISNDRHFKLQEAIDNTFTIQNFDTDTVNRMLQFMYGVTYDEAPSEENNQVDGETQSELSPSDQVRDHLKVNRIADFYQLPELASLASSRIKLILQEDWSLDCFMTVAAELPHLAVCRNLSDMAAEIAMDHLHEFVSDNRFEALEVIDRFAFKLLRDCGQNVKAMQEELEALRTCLAKANKTLQNAKDSLEVLQKTEKCRHCAVGKFDCYIAPDYILRCSNCNTKHRE
ncbi:uncharacterized protein UV8b_05484 [Ustilaginoidea virens]|uniref:BTB domain-containing protein n=2 Tax=Ustilaginoidea virens TaxID=1159556 RepID=A0A8E5MIP5_USTVR|nr:uncharacterized protein UV8b_05484 [Ustilaginoidea virens]QUC21241.1 hypothetical protein UV8b_05484 [Ustilaginoidea virens]